jgi:uncharacterized surface protein with fasciclin (FAS1) repeats
MRKLHIAIATALVGATAGAAFAQAPAAPAATPSAGGNLLAVAKADPQLSTFVRLAEAAGLQTTLAGSGPLTLLAPDNAAFAKLPAAQLADLEKPENVAQLQRVLMYHIIPGAAPSTALKGAAGPVDTAAQVKVTIDGTGPAVKVGTATVTRADIAASNGTIHVIDSVLVPAA